MPERIRVLQLLDVLDQNATGAERFAAGLAGALPSDRFEVALCASRSATGPLVDQLRSAGVDVFALGRRSSANLAPFRRLVRHLRDARVDVLHAHMFGSNAWGVLFGRLARVPVVLAHEHTWSYEGQPVRKLVDGQFIGRLATRFIAVSDLDRRRMVELEHVPAHKAVMVPTAYIPRGEGTPGDLRAELGLPPDAKLVGTIAQLRPQKALEVLLEAVAALSGRVPSVQLVIAGEGPSRAELERLAMERPELAGRTHFLGVRQDLATLLGAFDVAAMSSDFEGMPLFAFEAMAHGVPLVATRVGALPDIVDDGESGLLAPRRDPAALADALASVLERPERAAKLARGGLARVADYTLERAAERFAELYERLLAERGRALT
jgi:glycosyltransferase involved in cell wall biosynthesis